MDGWMDGGCVVTILWQHTFHHCGFTSTLECKKLLYPNHVFTSHDYHCPQQSYQNHIFCPCVRASTCLSGCGVQRWRHRRGGGATGSGTRVRSRVRSRETSAEARGRASVWLGVDAAQCGWVPVHTRTSVGVGFPERELWRALVRDRASQRRPNRSKNLLVDLYQRSIISAAWI